ncbi:hypothetical protein [Arthrobacter phage SWEP2]|uniref:Uncharacterized protein n=1 Tax=Arthrobacter phage SWEP2 TaxID=2945958 RepID=A0A9E7SI09_9CAUD|nr:hypothetical protein [Arthrobacter phage SWEP2]
MSAPREYNPRDGLIAVASLTLALVWLFVGPYLFGIERNIPLSAAVALVGAFVLFMFGGVVIQFLQAHDRKNNTPTK